MPLGRNGLLMRVQTTVLNRPLTADTIQLDEGWDVSILGGDSTHVGAVSLADTSGNLQTLCRAGHRDDVVSEKWAKALAAAWHTPVCVRCGIHYDDVDRAALLTIMAGCDELLAVLSHSCT